jgi:hypothetical protein
MPANERSVNILSSTGTSMNVTGEQVRYDSWYGYTDGFGTVMVTFQDFQGKLQVQGTLSLEPSDSDWFTITESADYTSEFTGSTSHNIHGNFTFIRAKLNRSHIGDGTTYDPTYGQITRVILST